MAGHDTYGAGIQTLRDWADNLRTLKDLPVEAAPAFAEEVKAELDKHMSAHEDPYGQAWAPGVEGEPVLNNAASHITTSAQGNIIWIELRGHYVFHHFGTHHVRKRGMLPDGGIPDKIGNAIRIGLVHMSQEWLTRKGRKKFGRGHVKGLMK
jgi:hypothetical protein